MSNILKGLLNEGAYEEGFSDGMNDRENPRASSIYGPDTEKYRSGFSAGLKKREEERQARIQAYQDSIQPYLDIPTDELEQRKQAAIDRSNDIRDIYNKLRGSDYSFDPKRHTPPNNEELSAEFKRLHNEIQAIHQVLYQRQRESMKETKEAEYGPNYQATVKRVGQMAKEGPRKTVYDPVKRVYKTVPVKQEVKEEQCPECGGPMFSDLLLAEKKDACYHKVRSRYKVWPSAYASGALVQCRKKGASNWGTKSEGVAEGSLNELSKDTLKSYAKKAVPDMQASQKKASIEAEKAASAKDDETAKHHYDAAKQAKDRTEKRIAGLTGAIKRVNKQGVAEGLGGQDFEQAHHDEVEKYIATHGTPSEYRHKYDDMGQAHNSYLTYPGRTVTINTQQYNGKVGHNVFTKRENVSEGPGFDKWADERAASQLHKLNKPHPKTWHDVDKNLGQAVDKMSQAEKVKKGFAHPDTLKKKGVAEEQLDEKCWDTHKQVGMKNKGGKMVPNCVPKESAIMKGIKL